MSLLHTARKAARTIGLDVQRANEMNSWWLRLPFFLGLHDIASVIDVGADNGDFAVELLKSGYSGNIISFEPLPDAHRRLEARAAAVERKNWIIGPQIALSDRNGVVEIFRAKNSVSSSILKMTKKHLDAAPNSLTVGSFTVNAEKLDDIIKKYAPLGRSFLKLDVQGAEKLVLDGASSCLNDVIFGLQVEMSLESLYEEQALAQEIIDILCAKNFKLWDIIPGFRQTNTCQLMQYDGIFFKS